MTNNMFERRFKFYKEHLLEKKNQFGELEFASATLQRFLPWIKRSEYLEFIALAQTYSFMALEDLKDFRLENVKVHPNYNKYIEQLQKGGNIICTFHCGSYRAIPLYLLLKNIPFKLVTDNKFILEQGEDVQKQVLRYSNEFHTKQKELEIISAEDKRGVFKCFKSIRQGYNLLFYIDGNRGVSNSYENPNFTSIPWFNSSFPSRVGVAYLAKSLNTQVYPIINKRINEHSSRIKFSKPFLAKNAGESDLTFAKKATRRLYRILAKEIKDDLSQWEGWLYLHLFVRPKDNLKENFGTSTNGQNEFFVFNEEDFGLMRIQDKHFLFDKNTFLTYPISEPLKLTIDHFKNKNTANKEIVIQNFKVLKSALDELKQKSIIIGTK